MVNLGPSDFLRRLNSKGRALGQVMTLLGGAVLAQAIALAASPMLSRLYTPEHFGTFALFASLVAVAATAATGRYEMAVIVPSAEADAVQLARLALLMAGATTVAVALLVAAGGERLLAVASDPKLWPWIWLAPVSVLLSAAIAVGSSLANRRQAYPRLAAARVAQSATTALASLGLGVALWGSPGLMLGTVLGQVVAVVIVLRGWPRGAAATPAFDALALTATAKRWAEFPRINLPHALLDALQGAAVLALIGAAWGGTALGVYAFALRIVRAPLAMLGAAVGQVFQQRAARKLANDRDLRPLARKTLARLLLFALPFALLLAWAPTLFGLLFGADWRDAGECVLLMAPWLLMNFITSPFSTLPLMCGRQRPAFVFGLAYQAAMVVPLATAWLMQATFAQALLWQSVVAAGVLLGYGAWLVRLAAPQQ